MSLSLCRAQGRSALSKKFVHASIHVPFLDMGEDGKSARTIATFKLNALPENAFTKRKVKRIVRKWLQHKLDKKIDIGELRKVLARGNYKTAVDLYIVQQSFRKKLVKA